MSFVVKFNVNDDVIMFARFNVNNNVITIERIMSTCAICLSSESNASMLTAVNLNVIRLIIKALSSKIEEDSVNLLH